MRIFVRSFICLGLMLCVSSPSLASIPDNNARFSALEESEELLRTTPLVTIRFYRPITSYDHLLYKAVQKAYNVKPNVVFEVKAAREDKTHLQGVIDTIAKVGIPESQIKTTFSETAQKDEVQIFAH